MTSRPAPGVPDEAPPTVAAPPRGRTAGPAPDRAADPARSRPAEPTTSPSPTPDPTAGPTADSTADSTAGPPLVGDTDAERHRLSPRVVAYWRWRWLFSLVPSLLLLAALAIVIPWGAWWLRWSLFAVLAVTGIAAIVVLPPIRFRVFWYAISATEIDIQHGIIFIKRSVIPMHRVQNLRAERGPIADHYRMATLRISTAADTLSVSGLARDEADAVCTRISQLADVADDV